MAQHRIPQDWLDSLLNKTDIVGLVDGRVPLKKAGANYQARCPFHTEKSPSFSVSPVKQTYHCFGCGAHGNAIGFLMEFDRMDFLEAVEWLAQGAGTEVPRFAKPDAARAGVPDDDLYAIQFDAMRRYQIFLKQSTDAVDYLKSRGVSGEIAKTFALGYAPDSWRNLPDWPMAAMVESGLMVDREGKHYDRFRGRVMFPVRDRRGRVMGFGGRALNNDAKPKYLNTAETAVFVKGREVYGLYELLQTGRRPDSIIVVEGNLDVIALAQFGLTNTVATLGTAIGGEQVALLFRYAHRLVFCFDGDEAGRKAAGRAMEAVLPEMRQGRTAGFVLLPDAQDPDSLIREEGAEAFRARVAAAVPLSEFFFGFLSNGLDLGTMEGRAALAALAKPLIKKIPCPDLQEQMSARLARDVGLKKTSPKQKINQHWLDYGPMGNV